MRRWLFLGSMVGGGLLVAILVAIGLLYWASQQAPEFYEQTLEASPAGQTARSDELLQQTTALVNDVKKEGEWRALFTAEQINGWLAVDLEKNHPGVIPSGVRDPRVRIKPEELTVACRYQGSNLNSVIWLAVDVYLVEPNVVALRIKKARAGLLPLPLEKVLETISRTAQRLDVHLQWRQDEGDPVALITLPPRRTDDNKLIRVESLELGDGELFVAGSTEPVQP